MLGPFDGGLQQHGIAGIYRSGGEGAANILSVFMWDRMRKYHAESYSGTDDGGSQQYTVGHAELGTLWCADIEPQ